LQDPGYYDRPVCSHGYVLVLLDPVAGSML
jgi:hypothetical protein